jgi:hypothetical protein
VHGLIHQPSAPKVSGQSGPTHRDGLGGPDHAVERCDGEGGFALLTRQGAGVELRTDLRIPTIAAIDSD